MPSGTKIIARIHQNFLHPHAKCIAQYFKINKVPGTGLPTPTPAQVQGYGKSIKQIMDRKRTSPPGSVSGRTSASDPHAKQPSPSRSVSRQVRAAKLAKTVTNKLLRSSPGNDQGSGRSQPSNDIPKHISISRTDTTPVAGPNNVALKLPITFNKKAQMLPFGSVMKPPKGANQAKASAK